MADLERFGGELFLDANQYISTIRYVERANRSFEESLRKTGDAATQLGLKFDPLIKGAEKFGKLRDIRTGRIVSGFEAINKVVDRSVNKYAALATSGRKSFRDLGQELTKLDTRQEAYHKSLERVRRAIVAASKDDADQVKAKQKINDAVATSVTAYRAYINQQKKVVDQGEKIKKENRAIVQSYMLISQRLAASSAGINKVRGAWSSLVARLAPVRNALAGVRAAIGSTATKTQAATGLIGAFTVVAGKLGFVLTGLQLAAKGVGKAFSLLISPIKKAFAALKNFLKVALQVATGILIRDVIRGLVRGFRDLAFAGFEAIRFFQALEIRLDLMELRALRAEGATGTMGEMFAMASDRAQRLTHWLKELSLQSPFTIETLATTTSLNLAMGFTEDMSKRLTVAIAEYTAGMGLSNQVMERIVFNFGQMKAAGKVTATEMRDLARGAFLPLVDVLDEAARLMNVATDDIMEFRKAAAEGAVDVDTFFRAFINVVERDFAGASERFARTLDGMMNRLKNLIKTVVGLEILKPVFDRFAERASEALDNLLQPELIERARMLGMAIVRSFDLISSRVKVTMHVFGRLWRAMGFGTVTFESLTMAIAKFTYYLIAAIDFVRKILRRLIDYFEDTGETLVDRMSRFGYNIIRFFAQGMASALHLVIRVLTWIGNAIAGLLITHSPPKLLPDLPKWGMDAMAEWLRGFTLADFDVLEGIQDPLKDALDILEETGEIAENQAGKIYADVSKAIAKALSTGRIGEELYAEIEKVTGPFGEEIAELARRQVELAAATEAVRKAEARLDAARKAHEAQRIKTNKLIRGYNEALREGADPAYLRSKLAEINASERAAQAAYEEQKAAETDLEAKEEQLTVIEEMLELQKRLVDQLLELTKAQIIQPEPLDLGAAAGAAAAVGDEEPIEPLPPLPEIELPDEEAIRAKIDEIFATAKAEVEKQIKELRKAFDESGIGQAFDNMTAAWRNAWTNATTWYETDVQPILDRIVAWWEERVPGLEESFGKMGKTLSATWETMKEVLAEVNERLDEAGLEDIGVSLEQVLDFIAALIVGIAGGITLVIALLGGLATGIIGGFLTAKAVLAEAWKDITEGVEKIRDALYRIFYEGATWEALGDLLEGIFEVIGGVIEATLGTIVGFIAGFIASIIEYFVELWHKLVGGSIVPEMMAEIYDAITKPLQDIADYWNELWQGLTDWWYDTLEPAIDDVITWLKNLKDEAITAYEEWRDNALEPFRKFFEETLPNAGQAFRDKFQEIMNWLQTNVRDPILDFVNTELENLRKMFADTLTEAIETFRTVVLEPLAVGIDAVKDAANRLWQKIKDLRDRLLAFPFHLLELLSGRSPSPLAIGIESASKAFKKLAAEALPLVNKQLLLMQASGFAASPVVAAPSVSPQTLSSSQAVNVNMGGVNIMSGMDEAMFEARVKNIVQKSLRV